MTILTTTSLPCVTKIEGVVESSCDGCNLLSLVLFCLYYYVALGENLRPKHERGFESGNYS